MNIGSTTTEEGSQEMLPTIHQRHPNCKEYTNLRQCLQGACDTCVPPLSGPQDLGFSPGSEGEGTAMPPTRATAPAGVVIAGASEHRPEYSPSLTHPRQGRQQGTKGKRAATA